MEKDTSSQVDFESTRANAEAVFARKLASHTIGENEKSQFLTGKITIDTGLRSPAFIDSENPERDETITITVNSPQIDQYPREVQDAIEKTLQGIEPIDEFVRARSAEEEIHYVKTKLAELKDAGAAIPESIFKWAGFDRENEKSNEVPEYLVDTVHSGSNQLRVTLAMPTNFPDGIDSDNIRKNIEERATDIKEMLAERLIREKHITSEEEAATIKEQVQQLELEVEKGDQKNISQHDDDSYKLPEHIYINIRSTEQVEAEKKRKEDGKATFAIEDNEELKKTNILQDLDADTLLKAVSKSIQTAGGEQKVSELMPIIAGANDIAHKLEKILGHFEKEHPDYHHQVADVLNSKVVNRSWRDDKDKFTKKPVVYKKDADPENRGKMTVEMVVPEGQANKIIEQLSALDPNAAKAEAEKFAHVDSAEIVGLDIHPELEQTHPELSQKLRDVAAPYVGQQLTAENSGDIVKAMGAKLVGLVEEAHHIAEEASKPGTTPEAASQLSKHILDRIEEAHQTVQHGIQAARDGHTVETEQPKPIVSETEHSAEKASLAHRSSDERPSPIMTPDWIQQLANKSSLALGA